MQMCKQLIDRPIIIAICGKSASGKDTLAKWLTGFFGSLGLYTHNMVSMTTRPPREGEEQGKDYYFVRESVFKKAIERQGLIEYTHFRNWKYGIPYKEVKPGYLNIGVFNLQGLQTLYSKRYNYTIIPVYLDVGLFTRLRRSHDRENHWRLEYIRRAFVDWKNFRHLDKVLKMFHGRYIYLDRRIDGVWRQSRTIQYALERWNILDRDKETGRIILNDTI